MSKQGYGGPIEQIDECTWRIPRSYKLGMRVEGRIFADQRLIEQIRSDQAPEQVANVASLPGIQMASLAMPDIHWGYGFCIGGVCATDPAEGGVVSPGGVGYDINCGVRLMRTNLPRSEVQPRIKELMDALYRQIPAGVGKGGPYLFNHHELRRILNEGVGYLESRELATPGDVEHTEASGCLKGANPDFVSNRAIERGGDQCGTLGSGNHFLEVQVVDEIFDPQAARTMGLQQGGICVMIHSGSRGLGYQVCEDALELLRKAPAKYGIELPDRQLACAPVHSPEGQHYLGAMRAAANFAWANRQLLMWQARETFAEFFGQSWQSLQMNLVYDVAHNIAKIENHTVDGRMKSVCVHRKGATRAFPPDHPELPDAYRQIGQPVIIPGDMGPGELGAGRATGQHGAVFRLHVSRCGPRNESHGRHPACPGPADRPGAGPAGRHCPLPGVGRDWRRSNRRLIKMSVSWWMWYIGRDLPERSPACVPSESSRAEAVCAAPLWPPWEGGPAKLNITCH